LPQRHESADIARICIKLKLFKSRRRAVGAVCPESLPRARQWYLEWLFLRLFACAGVGGQGRNADYTDRTDFLE